MNNKGFTLIEVLVTIGIISILTVVTIREMNFTLSATNNEAYEIMKSNIISAGELYVKENEANILDSDFSFSNKNNNSNKVKEKNKITLKEKTKNSFKASVLKKYGYFNNLKSPVDGKDLGDCLVLTATKSNGNITVTLKDNCYN